MKGRVIEVHTAQGDFLVSEKDGRVVCEALESNGLREIGHLVEVPEEAKVPVFLAAQQLSYVDNRYISRDQSTNNGSLNFDGFIHT